jgi:hypothetical protein
MTKIRSPFDEPVRVPWLNERIVGPDEVVQVPDQYVENFLAGGWQLVDPPTDPPTDVDPPVDPPAPRRKVAARPRTTPQEG